MILFIRLVYCGGEGGTTHSDFAFKIFKINYPSGCGPTVERRVVGVCAREGHGAAVWLPRGRGWCVKCVEGGLECP